MKKSVKLILIFAAIFLVVSVVTGILAIVFSDSGDTTNTVSNLGYGELKEPSDLSNEEKIAGYTSVLNYGAKPDDNTDDTDAFEAAIKKNIAVYVPAGKYIVSRPLPFNDQNFFGDGENATVIVSRLSDKTKPIVYLGGSSALYDMSLEYSAELLSGKEQKGERVAVMCGAAVGFGPGGAVRDVTFKNVGTAVYSDASDGFGAQSSAFERIGIDNFTYCGFDFNCDAGYGNYFSQITAKNSGGVGVFTFTGSGGTDILENITVNNCNLQYAIGSTELAGATVGSYVVTDSKFSKEEVFTIKE